MRTKNRPATRSATHPPQSGSPVPLAPTVALGAEKLLLVTGAPGILAEPGDPASLVSYTDLAGLAGLEAEGRLKDGMLPKVAAIRTALAGGVARVHVISYRTPESLLLEVFTNEGCGTLVVRDRDELRPAEAGEAGAP